MINYSRAILHIENVIHFKKNSFVEANIVYVRSNYGFLSVTIVTHFESSGVLSSETISIVNNTPDKTDNTIERLRFKTIVKKNSGFKKVY